MNKYKVGLLAETKTPPDRRAALTPTTAAELVAKYPNVELFVQPGKIRAFKDSEYTEKGLNLKENLSDCDILIGVKEVKIETLIPEKTYIFFAHVAKKQPYNKPLLKAIIDKKNTLIDYEYLTDKKGNRLVAFGKWAGVVGAYNGLRTWGLRTKQFNIKPAHEYLDKKEMFSQITKLNLEPIKIVITGGGRVAGGAMETLNAFGIKEVTPEDFLTKKFFEPVFTKLEPWHYAKHKDDRTFELQHFFDNPHEYVSIFELYTKVADIYLPCHFWHPASPKFITQQMMREKDFNIKVVADISCDIKGPVASTIRSTSIDDPFYDYNPITEKEEPAFSSDKNVTVMAIDNLPAELPRDSSEEFSKTLLNNVFHSLLIDDSDKIIERACIVYKGQLTDKYKYLSDWVNS